MQEIALSVIIPYYQETPEELFFILSALNGQMGADHRRIECILVNDGSGSHLPEDFLGLFKKLNIRCLYLPENKGPGMARQAGIDAAAGEYVMFCDADDGLNSPFVFNAILAEISANHPELIVSSWLEESYNPQTDSYHYSQHDIDFVWMHGKAIKRAFLLENNLRFHEELRVHEDNYFMGLVYAAAEDMRKIPAATYVWKYRPDSITRAGGGAYFYETILEFIKSTGCLFAATEKQFPGQIKSFVVQGIINIFFILHRREWQDRQKEDRLAAAEAAFGQMILPYLHYFKESPASIVSSMYNQERNLSFQGEIESERLEDWLERILPSQAEHTAS